jgi:hypothetical protein
MNELKQSETTARGFKEVVCIACGNADATVSVMLHDLNQFHCSECDAEFSVEDVRAHLAAWTRVLDWISLAPELE